MIMRAVLWVSVWIALSACSPAEQTQLQVLSSSRGAAVAALSLREQWQGEAISGAELRLRLQISGAQANASYRYQLSVDQGFVLLDAAAGNWHSDGDGRIDAVLALRAAQSGRHYVKLIVEAAQQPGAGAAFALALTIDGDRDSRAEAGGTSEQGDAAPIVLPAQRF